MSEIKLSDLGIRFSDETRDELTHTIQRLSQLSKEYDTYTDIHNLESLKREFNAQLERFSTLYCETLCFKGSNHTYLEGVEKRLRAETLKILMDSGNKVTAAENLVFSQPYYVQRMELADELRRFFIKVEKLHAHFNTTLRCIIQSISVETKEWDNSKAVS